MAEPQPASEVAKALGIYLGQIYPMVEKGAVKNYKPDGKYNVEGGKGLVVDIDEVRAAMSTGRKRGGKGSRGPKAGSKAHARLDAAGAEGVRKARKEKLDTGQIVSYHGGVATGSGKDYGSKMRVITGRYRSLTYLAGPGEGDHYHLFSTEKLRDLLAKGIAHLERPEGVLGMVIFHWLSEYAASDGSDARKLKLAESLEKWLTANNLEVAIPEPILMDEAAEAEPVVEDEELAGDDDE